MKLFNSTKKWSDWWGNRKIDWKVHYMNPEHPHRSLIAEILKHIRWTSLIEIGCGAGANLVVILKMLPNKMVGGVDINKDAIEFAKTQFQNGLFKVNRADDVMMSDKSTDVILTDMMLIYVNPGDMGRHLKEFKRIARGHVVFCEFHSNSLWKRLVTKWKEGYNVYDYKKLLEKHGFNDIRLFKVPPNFWPESDIQQELAHVIVAKVPIDY